MSATRYKMAKIPKRLNFASAERSCFKQIGSRIKFRIITYPYLV
jgi:hypothetical protein